MMRAVLLLMVLMLLLSPADAAVDAAAWKQRNVVVFDYSGPEWRPFVLDAIARFNAQLPKRAPRLELRQMAGPCKRHKNDITICVVTRDRVGDPRALAMTTLSSSGGEMERAFMTFADDTKPELYIACHELFHAMGVGGHAEWTAARPCPYDDALMHKKYKRQKKHR